MGLLFPYLVVTLPNYIINTKVIYNYPIYIVFSKSTFSLQLKLAQYRLWMTMILCWTFIQEGGISFLPPHPLFCPLCIVERFPPAYMKCAYSFILSDITALAKDKAYARTSLEEISIHQVITA